MKYNKTIVTVVGVISFFAIIYFYADTATNRKKMAAKVQQEVLDFQQKKTTELEMKLRRRLNSSWDFERGYTIVEIRELGAQGGVFKPEVQSSIGHRDKFYRREAILTLAIIQPKDEEVLGLLGRLVEERGDIGSFAIDGIAKMAKVSQQAKAFLGRLATEHPDEETSGYAKLLLEFYFEQ